MTEQQIQFIRANEIHILHVIEHNQPPQASHDLGSQVLAIYKALTGQDSACCDACIVEAYKKVWNAYQLNNATKTHDHE